MCGADKFNCLMPYTFSKLEDVDYLVTDGMLPENFRDAAEAAGVTIL
jgi:DeoR/GlpR family transcriptional regulator of sugar metabolism